MALEQTVSTIDMELKKLDQAKEAVEQAIEVKVLDLDIVNEIMSIREQRRGNDYVMDEAQLELTKVCILIIKKAEKTCIIFILYFFVKYRKHV